MFNVFRFQFLTITGHIKETLITKGGENVALVPVESLNEYHLVCSVRLYVCKEKVLKEYWNSKI